MPSVQAFSLRRILPSAVFDQLSSVMQQMVRELADGALVVTEAVVPISQRPLGLVERFVVVVSPQFNGLLLAETLPGHSTPAHLPLNQALSSEGLLQRTYQLGLTFCPTAIATFLTELSAALQHNPGAVALLERAAQQLQPNDATVQSEFTLRLVEVIAAALTIALPTANDTSCDLAIAAALQQQVEQERLLNQVTTLIRQSMELPVVLQTTVQQVLHLLQADRVLIYQFNLAGGLTTGATIAPPDTADRGSGTLQPGRITYEATTSSVASVLHLIEQDSCFVDVPDYRAKYRKGLILAADDVEATFALSPCLLKLMQRAQARAKLVVPIVVQEDLWGLLIVHQCSGPRRWQEHEQTFSQRIAEHLAIAIYQAGLYAQVQQQAQTLEQRVVDRTQALHDALSAAESAGLAKAEFLAAMSHELRTPLTSIIGMAATLLRLPDGPDQLKVISWERQRNYLRTIQTSGEHLLHLINDILDLSQLEAGRMMLDIQEFSLRQIANESLQILKDQAEQQQIHLKLVVTIPPSNKRSDDDRFVADPRRVKQILLNLLSNAIKFTPAGGQVTLQIGREGNLAVFQVEDTGIGIPDSQRSLLFNKFQQLDMSYQRRYEGTGLGLALTKQLVELHRGWIDVQSTVDVGSIFAVRLPEQTLDTTKPRSSNPDVAPPHGRIVLIDDHDETATLICNLLTTAGYQIVWMSSGTAVMQQIKILQPIALLVGMDLSGMNAADMLQTLQQDPDTQVLPILVVSEADHTDEILKDAGYRSVSLQHPEQLLSKLAALIASAEAQS